LKFNPHAPSYLQDEVFRIGRSVFTSTPPAVRGVNEVLSTLMKTHRLALFTAGDQEIQKRRLEAFQRIHYFDHVRIVPLKDADQLGALLREIRAKPLNTWAVGDSLRSDIYPAVQHGLKAIHIDVQNWHPVETGQLSLPPGVHRVGSIEEAALIIQNTI
jgi:putative hydrolase of the HAD superfamily